MGWVRFLIILAIAAAGPAAFAQSGTASRLDDFGLIGIAGVDGETVSVRLAGIELPRDGAPGHGLAMRFIDDRLADVRVSLIAGEGHTDRYGNLIGDIDLGGQSLAAALVRNGLALAYSWPESREAASALLPLEEEARSEETGLWGAGIFTIRSPDPNTLALYLETVQIVEGRVISVAATRDRTYLNFGFDYRTDFTVSVETGDIARFEEAGIDLAELEGRNVRVRGWIRAINGPAISIDHPERLEVLTP